MNRNFYRLIFSGLIFSFLSCGGSENETTEKQPEPIIPLPYMGQHEIDGTDTVYHTIPDYVLLAHDSTEFTNERVKNKIHVVNFFFTSCPAICPAMIGQMQRLQGNTTDIEELVFLSHTVDPVRDTIPKLRTYIEERNIDTRNWFFLYGEKEYVYDLGMNGYILNAMEDEKAEGGFLHSEYFVLIDRERHIRGMYDGTETEQVDQLEKDIRKLLKEEYAN
ncbi:MAG: SCO family protein [Crocinitomicaceae bacterium]|nr:SCO family protein [Crocinitomicaceae bacterium]